MPVTAVGLLPSRGGWGQRGQGLHPRRGPSQPPSIPLALSCPSVGIGHRYSHIQVWNADIQRSITPDLRELASPGRMRFRGSGRQLASASAESLNRKLESELGHQGLPRAGTHHYRVDDGALRAIDPNSSENQLA